MPVDSLVGIALQKGARGCILVARACGPAYDFPVHQFAAILFCPDRRSFKESEVENSWMYPIEN
jgi:hypothetical protein